VKVEGLHESGCDKVVGSLRVVKPPVPQEDMLRLLDDMRERVVRGELNFIGVVATYHDAGSTANGWAGAKGVQRFTVLGAIEAMKLDYWSSSIEGK